MLSRVVLLGTGKARACSRAFEFLAIRTPPSNRLQFEGSSPGLRASVGCIGKNQLVSGFVAVGFFDARAEVSPLGDQSCRFG